MYIGLNLENIVTVGVILILWMVALHLLGQLGVYMPAWLKSISG